MFRVGPHLESHLLAPQTQAQWPHTLSLSCRNSWGQAKEHHHDVCSNSCTMVLLQGIGNQLNLVHREMYKQYLPNSTFMKSIVFRDICF